MPNDKLPSIFYFAYGSNMNRGRIHTRLPNAVDLGSALLRGWRVVERKTADIEPCRAAEAPGVLYAVTVPDIARMDVFEGFPTVYTRKIVRVCHQGRLRSAVTYRMTRQTAAERAGQPYAEAYRLLCWMGAEEHDLPNCFTKKGINAMQKNADTALVAVYGTLLKGEGNERVPRRVLSRQQGTVSGSLFDTGYGFPTFLPSPKTARVEVEVIEVPTEVLLRDLDRLEGYPHLYNRVPITVDLEDGTQVTAWIYTMPILPRSATPIPSGSWRRR